MPRADDYVRQLPLVSWQLEHTQLVHLRDVENNQVTTESDNNQPTIFRQSSGDQDGKLVAIKARTFWKMPP